MFEPGWELASYGGHSEAVSSHAEAQLSAEPVRAEPQSLSDHRQWVEGAG